jgi:hypothetical protein
MKFIEPRVGMKFIEPVNHIHWVATVSRRQGWNEVY